jgi:alpha-methylacyl-CoA racemase
MEVTSENVSAGPLAGVRVLEIGAIGPAPYACMLLSDLGAKVVRVDRLSADPFSGGGDPRYDFLLRGRERIGLDLKTPQGRNVVLRLAMDADLFVEGFRPGVAEKLGIGPDHCFARNPRLVYGRMTGWGQSGPLAQAAGHDINYIALTGALHAIGSGDGAPTIPLNLIGDFAGGSMFLVMGLLAGLVEARRTGKGQVVDAAMVDGAASLMTAIHAAVAAGFWKDQRGSNLLDGGAPFYSVYQTLDDKYVAIGAIEPKFFAVLVDKLALEPAEMPLQYDPSHWPELRAKLQSLFRTKTRAEWCVLLEGTDACFAPVLALGEARDHAHIRAREGFVAVDGVDHPAPAPRFSRTRAGISRAGVGAGTDTTAVLEAAGFGPAEIESLAKAGVIKEA